MAAPNVSVEVYQDSVLGVGSYGKVCKAKYGQLPCAAKLLHETLLEQGGDPGRATFAERFEQECQFLCLVKHPNIVQYLGTLREPRMVLLMELMDQSLTKFLQRSVSPLPYHIQLNICHDVALALSYLHSNDIIHRDLSSNNVLLIGEGSRAKVTDFGMSKLIDANPRMTPLTLCPGTAVYMPPEALTTPPSYSTKLDCFSYGVLTIQTVTRRFPTPRDATTTIEDSRYPTGRVVVFVPETERRKAEIDLIEHDHPLYPIALSCIKDRDFERPSADEVCEALSMLKLDAKYKHSLEQPTTPTIQPQREDTSQNYKEAILEKEKAVLQAQVAQQANYQAQLEHEITQLRAAQHTELETKMSQLRTEYEQELTTRMAQLQMEYQNELAARLVQLQSGNNMQKTSETVAKAQLTPTPANCDPQKLKWRQGKPAAQRFTGMAFVHGNTAYFSNEYDIYAFTVPDSKWSRIQPSKYRDFSMAVVNGMLTTIGGRKGKHRGLFSSNHDNDSNVLMSISPGGVANWQEVFPRMPTGRYYSAALTSGPYLVVVGGEIKEYTYSYLQ